MRVLYHEGGDVKGHVRSCDKDFIQWILRQLLRDRDEIRDVVWRPYATQPGKLRYVREKLYHERRVPWLVFADCDHDHGQHEPKNSHQQERAVHVWECLALSGEAASDEEKCRIVIVCNEIESWIAAAVTPPGFVGLVPPTWNP